MSPVSEHRTLKRPNEVVGGHYRVVQELGKGGMGVVYKVRDEKLDGRVRALKMMLPALLDDPEAVRRFRQEVRALARLKSEFIVEILDASVDDGTSEPFFVTEFVEGRTLHDLLQEKGVIERTVAIGLLQQLAVALEVIHAHGIVHRDLKPSNVFLYERELDGLLAVKLMDFGIAKFSNPLRPTTMIAGSEGYMAPEQASGYNVDHRADIFALGRLADAMLFGEASSDLARQGTVSAPQPYAAWLARATAWQANERFHSAVEAVRRLAEALDLPQRPSTPAWSVSPRSWGRASIPSSGRMRIWRRRAWVVAALAVLAAAVGAVRHELSRTDGTREEAGATTTALPGAMPAAISAARPPNLRDSRSEETEPGTSSTKPTAPSATAPLSGSERTPSAVPNERKPRQQVIHGPVPSSRIDNEALPLPADTFKPKRPVY